MSRHSLMPAITALMLLAPTARASLYISEYVEGSSNNKAIELFNSGGSDIDLSTIGLAIFSNGSTNANSTPISVGELIGTLSPGDTFVVADDGWGLGSTAGFDLLSSDSFFNGDDAVVLFQDSLSSANYLDVIGQIGNDPGSRWGGGNLSTSEHTLRRIPSITTGDTDGSDFFDPSIEWLGFPQDDAQGLGTHNGEFSVDGGAVPEPGSILVFASLFALAGVRRGAIWATQPLVR